MNNINNNFESSRSGSHRFLKFFISLLILASLAFIFYNRQTFLMKAKGDFVTVNSLNVKVELADTDILRYQGLSNHPKLCEFCGMLFIFPDKQVRTFVMRDMLFPLDIIFINDNKVVKIESNLEPEGNQYLTPYSSDVPADFVLEVNSGFTDKYSIEIGQEIKFNLKK
jgi:hypothetical protein